MSNVANEVICPKCGEHQPKRNLCRACAIDMPRFLAARAAEEAEQKAARMVAASSGHAATQREPKVGLREVPDLDQGLDGTEVPADIFLRTGISRMEVISVALLVVLLATFVIGPGWVPVLDSANLALHEAGHPLIGLLSRRLEVYGGTIFQLLFPLTVVAHFYRRSHSVGVAVGVIWLGESLHNVARYMADARAQELPLVGGGEHDWTEIFSRWGVLHFDTRIGNLTHALAWLLMLGAVVWLVLRYHQGRESRRHSF